MQEQKSIPFNINIHANIQNGLANPIIYIQSPGTVIYGQQQHHGIVEAHLLNKMYYSLLIGSFTTQQNLWGNRS